MSVIGFDPLGPLPDGRTLLEASAGTGKTWTIAALVTRYVAEAGIPIEEMLVVTFTRAATSELRERTRSRLVEAARHLRAPGETDDPILAHLAACDETERELRRRRLDVALRTFDRATITTLHGLAHRFLVEMGLLSRTSLPREVVGDQDDLVDQVVNDLYVRMFADAVGPLKVKDATDIARAVAGVPDADIIPAAGELGGDPDIRARFAHEVRRLLTERMRSGRVTSFDGLLLAARDAVIHTETGRHAAARLWERYQVALIDEFQDTDGIQWQTVDAVFADATSTMVLIGDPKQSIYAFRGADIGAYLEAATGAASSFTLDTNWRSDGLLLKAFDVVFEGVSFGDERIPYRTVSCAPGREGSGIRQVGAPLVIRCVGRNSPVRPVGDGSLSVPAARTFIAEDVAAYVVDLLSTPAELTDGDGWRPVRPGDIAVLCRTRAEVDQVRSALAARRVPSVVARTGNVLQSQAADEWLTLLEALEFPASTTKVRAVALTSFLGWSPIRLASADDDDLLPLHEMISRWAETLRTHGVAATWKAIEGDCEVSRRVLASPNGERLLTDIGHVTEMIHTAHRTGALSLHEWLLAAIQRAAARDDEDEERSRRLETDADAVQVLTAHASKGLEFSIVLSPFFWNGGYRAPSVPVFHPAGSDRRLIEVGGKGSWDRHDEGQRLVKIQSDGEDMRLLYVALTRARHHAAVWWAMTKSARTAPLTRFLFGRTDGGIKDDVQLVSDDRMWGHLDSRIALSDGSMFRQVVNDWPPLTEIPPNTPATATLDVARFGRSVDMAWTRTSFSSLTADAPHEARTDPEAAVKTDEPTPDDADPPVVAPELPMASLPGGMAFGNLVHAVFEEVDLDTPDREERIRLLCESHVASSASTADPAVLTAALLAVAETPLFASTDRPRLVDLFRTDQRAEMQFEIPVSPDGPTVPVAEIASLMERHLPETDPLRAYADRIRTLTRHRFHGFLTGAIDSVVRIGEPARYWVMDYKTNWLGDRSRALTIDDYRPAALDRAMLEGDYVLQSLLYQVALHRYLGARLVGYRPEDHLGGSLYLFVRGMIGESTPTAGDHRHGVHRWDAPHDLIAAVSDLFELGMA